MTKSNAVLAHYFLLLLAMGLVFCSLAGCSHNPESKAISTNAIPHYNSAPESVQDQSVQEQESAVAKGPVSVSIDDAQKQEIGLTTTTVKRGLVYKMVDSPGRVGPNAELTTLVSTPSAGRALEIKARLGDIVQAGQVMAIIKSDPIGQIQSDLLQSALQAKADIRQQEVQLKLSHITFERESKLYKEQVSAKADLQTAENQLEKDEANLAALKAKLEAIITANQERLTLLGAAPDSARTVLAQRKLNPFVVIRAPRGGLVIERTINPGELNDGTKQLFTVATLSEVWLFADIFEKDIAAVKKGQEAVVTIDSLPNDTFPAKIIWVGDSISPTTRTLSVRANVANPNYLLKPGMFARMKVSVGQISVLQIPKSAVLQEGDKELVFVETGNGTYEEKEVQTGAEDANNIEILGGLTLGERVVVHGGTALLGAAMKSSEGK